MIIGQTEGGRERRIDTGLPQHKKRLFCEDGYDEMPGTEEYRCVCVCVCIRRRWLTRRSRVILSTTDPTTHAPCTHVVSAPPPRRYSSAISLTSALEFREVTCRNLLNRTEPNFAVTNCRDVTSENLGSTLWILFTFRFGCVHAETSRVHPCLRNKISS